MSTIHISPNDITLTDVTRHPDGSVASGYVLNSGWFFKRGNGVQQSFTSEDAKEPVHTWRDSPITETVV